MLIELTVHGKSIRGWLIGLKPRSWHWDFLPAKNIGPDLLPAQGANFTCSFAATWSPGKKKVSSCGGGFDMIVVRLLFIDVYCVFFRRNMLPLFMLQDRQHVEPSQSELQTVGFLFLTVLPLVVWSLSKQPADKCEFRQGSQLSYFLHLLTWVWVKPGEHHISWQMDVHPSKYCILFNNSFWCIHTYYIHLLHLLCSAVW